MDHVDLTPYPFPEGIAVPRLMPFQDYPWNNDGYLAAEVLRLRDKHGLTKAFETGTCLGSTTLWLREHFRHTYTVDVNNVFMGIAHDRFIAAGIRHIRGEEHTSNAMFGRLAGGPEAGNSITANIDDSAKSILKYKSNLWTQQDDGDGHFFFLDAHWNDHCPLLEELDAIAAAGIKPCIVIHDFQVPGTDFGFDRFPDSGYPFNLDAIAPRLDAIYGVGKWKRNYPTQVEGARRGWISIEPC
jgi:hypothetical protein